LPFLLLDLKKQIIRGNYIDAFANYVPFFARFVSLMNIKYRPAKYDFGLRYLYRDFPENEAKFIENLIKINSLEDMTERIVKIEESYEKLILELSVKYR